MWNSVIFSMLTGLYSNHHHLIKNIFVLQKSCASHSPLSPTSPFPKRLSALVNFLTLDLPILDMSYKWNPKYKVFCDWLTFTLHVFRVYPCWSMCWYFSPFYCWIIFHILHFTYAFINWRTFVFSTFCCYESSCANFCVDICFTFSLVYMWQWHCWVMWEFCV